MFVHSIFLFFIFSSSLFFIVKLSLKSTYVKRYVVVCCMFAFGASSRCLLYDQYPLCRKEIVD